MPLVCIASPKGGVGKTMIAANLAHALCRAGRRVLAIDCDPQNALRLHFGLPLDDHAGFMAGLPRRPDWRAAIRETPSRVRLLPHGTVDARSVLALAAAMERDPDLLGAPLRAILADPDLVGVADTAPGPSQALAALVPHAAILAIVLLADGGSTAQLPELESGRFLGRGTLGSLFAARMHVVLNEVESGSRLSTEVAGAMARHFGPRLLGAICRDTAVAEALACQRLVADHAPDSPAAADLQDIAQTIDLALFAAAPAQPAAAPLWGPV
jgi:cellulose synthase operon protein YhjQ